MRVRAVAGLLLSAAVSGCAVAHTDDAVPTARTRPGWCHRLADPAELYAPSDVAPPVPCWSPHRSETLATVRLPLALTRLPGPPVDTGGLANVVCAAPRDHLLHAYLGADDLDRHWGIDIWLKVPTRREWSHGVRVGRCDLILGRGASQPPPMLTHALRGALRRADSSTIRHCRLGAVDVTCDRPHDAEEAGGWTGLADAAHPGAAAAARLLRDQCWRNAERYTGGGFDALPVRAVPGPLTVRDWQAGRRTTDCWIAAQGGPATVGTLRADLTATGRAR